VLARPEQSGIVRSYLGRSTRPRFFYTCEICGRVGDSVTLSGRASVAGPVRLFLKDVQAGRILRCARVWLRTGPKSANVWWGSVLAEVSYGLGTGKKVLGGCGP